MKRIPGSPSGLLAQMPLACTSTLSFCQMESADFGDQFRVTIAGSLL